MEAKLRSLYQTHTNREIAALTGWQYRDVMYKGKNLGLKKFPGVKSKACGVTPWPDHKLQFLKDNFHIMTNPQLANALGITLTVLRNKARELGMKRIEMEYWNADQVKFLIDNFRILGDVEIMHHFEKHYPKAKSWTRSHINKKRRQMNLVRTQDEIDTIVTRNVSKGGPSFTILKNSSSVNLTDGYVANCIAWRDPELKAEVLKHSELLNLKRQQIRLSREIKEVRNGM